MSESIFEIDSSMLKVYPKSILLYA